MLVWRVDEEVRGVGDDRALLMEDEPLGVAESSSSVDIGTDRDNGARKLGRSMVGGGKLNVRELPAKCHLRAALCTENGYCPRVSDSKGAVQSLRVQFTTITHRPAKQDDDGQWNTYKVPSCHLLSSSRFWPLKLLNTFSFSLTARETSWHSP